MKVTRIVLYSEMAAHGIGAVDCAIMLIEKKWFKTPTDRKVLKMLKEQMAIMQAKRLEIKNFHKMAHAKLFWNKEEKAHS